MENGIIKKLNNTTSMEETQKRNGIQKQQKFAINLGTGRGGGIGIGIGIGVGIILVGGALVVNAFQKKQSKPTSNNIKKNNNNTPQEEEEEDNLFQKQDDTFHSNLSLGPHSSSYIHQHFISDESSGISAQNMLQDLKCDDDESMGCNGSVDQKEEELSSDSLLHQSEDISCIAMELPETIDGIEKTNADQESHQSKIGEANTEMLSIIEEISALIDRDQESYSNAEADSSCFKMLEADKRDEILVLGSKRGQDDDLLALGSTDVQGDEEDKISGAVEMCVSKGINDSQVDVTLTAAAVEVESLKGKKQPQTLEVSEDKIHAQIIGTAGEAVEEIEAENEVQIDSWSEQTSKLNECHATFDQDSNHVLLTTSDTGVLDAVESEEDVEEKETEHDVQTDAAAGQVIPDQGCNHEVFDTDELLKAPKTKIQSETPEAVEGREAHEVQIDTTGSKIDSDSEQTSKLNECQSTADQDSVDAGILDAVESLKEPKTENQTNEVVESIGETKGRDCTLTNATEEDVEEKETQHDVQADAAGQVIVDQGCNHEIFDADELLEEPESNIQPETHTVEGKEAQYDVQINAVGEESEEKKDQHDTKVNAVEVIEENKAQDCTVTNAKEEEVEEKETEHDVQTNAAGQVILNQGCNLDLLDIADAGAFGAYELLQAPKTKIQPETHRVEGKETQYDFQINTAGGEENKDQHNAQTNEAVEVLEEKQAQGSTINNATEEEVEEKETEHDVQTDAARKVILDQGCNHEVFDPDELLEAPRSKIQPENHSVEGKEVQCDVQINAVGEESEEKKDQHDAKMNEVEVIEEQKAQECTVTIATKEEVEETETQHDVKTDHEIFDADELLEALKSKIQPETHTVEGNEAECDVHMNAAGQESEEKKDQNDDAKIDAAGSEQTSNLIELQDYTCHISHQMTSENILPQENEQNMSQLNPVMGLNGEFEDGAIDHLHSSMINTEFIFIKPSAEEVNGDDDPLVQSAVEAQLIHQENEKSLKEFHDISPASSAVDTIIEDHLESVQEAPIQVTKEILIMDEKEKLLENEVSVTTQQKMEKEVGAKSLKIVNDEKESSDMNPLKKYKLKLAEQNAEVKGLLMRNRAPIVIGTMSALLCPLCHWYFGLPLVKICLIAVLVMLLSMIQAFYSKVTLRQNRKLVE